MTPPRFYNTRTRSLEEFEPLEDGSARMYACGPTVYQAPHIGNYRTFLFNDLLHRYLEWKGYEVRFVMNLTDVDDKTIDGALRQGISLGEFTAPVIPAFFDDLDALGMQRADAYPRATHYVEQMIAHIARLFDNGHAYRADDGSVYYDVSSFDGYGRLSGIDPDELAQGEPAEEGKRDARDFALWKAAKPADREAGAVWETPWGAGRPGWHLECSTMSIDELGESFDIHTGGEDLVFPHHEDEIAQAEGATGRPFVRYWLHSKHLRVNGEKMSKSLGNQYTLDDLTERGHSLAAIRYLLLSAHYRRELNFTFDGLDDARAALRRPLDFADRLERAATDRPPDGEPRLRPLANTALDAFEAALDDDLNTAAALAALFDFVRSGNAALDESGDSLPPDDLDAATGALDRMDDVLGLLSLARGREGADEDFAAWVEERLAEREEARERRDFETADTIRDELADAAVVIEDTPQGTRWRRG